MMSTRKLRVSLHGLLAMGILMTLSAPRLMAQEDEPRPKAGKTETEKEPAKKEKKSKDEPEDVELTTLDGVKLAVTYYPGSHGKESVPVILLHDFKGSRADFTKDDGLAPYLHKNLGCAVIVPDLRGHGDSKVRTAAAGGKPQPLSAASLKKNEFPLMVAQDLLRVKKFLCSKNNRDELNVNKMCVVGVGMGASVAMEFALFDACGYEHGTPIYGLKKLQLGRFVKALVLVSPEWSSKQGFSAGTVAKAGLAGAHVRSNIPVLIFVGKENATALKEATRVYDMFKQMRKTEPTDKKTLLLGQLATSLQGMKALDHAPLRVMPVTVKFLTSRVLENPEAKKDWAWKEYEVPQ